MSDCDHIVTRGRPNEKGSWCIDCGLKVFDVDKRECKDCKQFKSDVMGSFCSKHLMRVPPDMNVTFEITKGTCWEPNND